MKSYKIKIFILALITLCSTVIYPMFDLMDYNAPEPAAMGMAFTAMENNINCINFNPAGLYNITGINIEYNRLNPYKLSDLYTNQVMLTLPSMIDKFQIGISYFGLNYDNIYTEDVFNIAVSYKINKSLIVGNKLILGRNNIDYDNFEGYTVNRKVYPYSISPGILYNIFGIHISFVLNNVYSSKYNDIDRLPFNPILGCNYTYKLITISMDYSIEKNINNKLHYNMFKYGIKYNISDYLSLMAGYRPQHLSAGFKLEYDRFSFLYTLLIPTELEVTHYFGLRMKFSAE